MPAEEDWTMAAGFGHFTAMQVRGGATRGTEVLVRDRVKSRTGRYVYLAFSRDETQMRFGFPKAEREAMVAAEPDKFLMPGRGDLRCHWLEVRLSSLDLEEMRELVLDAWRMCVPKGVAAAYDAEHGA